MTANTPPPIAAPKIGTAVAGASPPEELEDAAAPVSDDAVLVPAWCLPAAVALCSSWETVASADLSEEAAVPTKEEITRQHIIRLYRCVSRWMDVPVAVAKAMESECLATLASLNTLFSALAMVLLSAVCADRAECRTALLCAASDAAAPERVWPARSEEMMAAAWLAAAALAALAAAIMEAAWSVAAASARASMRRSGWSWAEARALRPATRRAVTRMLRLTELWLLVGNGFR